MLIKRSPNGVDLPFSSEITPQAVYESRRKFIAQMAVGAAVGSSLWEMANREAFAADAPAAQKLAG
ncbi:MAG: protein-methionine-sulfoxide reductase catalytic subunit MsrP, partial [Massilia sp.]|nr:protein-methionine-sulfoxide reductase catalytic subunit MsrP [Massilia sp.]